MNSLVNFPSCTDETVSNDATPVVKLEIPAVVSPGLKAENEECMLDDLLSEEPTVLRDPVKR